MGEEQEQLLHSNKVKAQEGDQRTEQIVAVEYTCIFHQPKETKVVPSLTKSWLSLSASAERLM